MGQCVEVYVDDMVVKSPSHHQHMQDLSVVFSALRQYNLRLNPDKCVFGVDRGKFLGFMLTQRGIEANPEKCKALSLVHAARRLCPYFQNHSIIVKTDYPIQKILQKPDLVGQMSS